MVSPSSTPTTRPVRVSAATDTVTVRQSQRNRKRMEVRAMVKDAPAALRSAGRGEV